ncbi:MAG: hypothetical protein IPK77_12155 [Cellvibrio sp.]|nr:hypothetical protein [Cellvibrio sp.]
MKKYTVIILLLIFILGYFFLGRSGNNAVDDNDNVVITDSAQKDSTKQNTHAQYIGISNAAATKSVNDVPQRLITENELLNIKEWDRSNGKFSDSELNEYGQLSPNTLEELAKKGDLKAIQTLADHEAILGNTERSLELWNWAAVHGSTEALMRFAYRHGGDYVSSKRSEDALDALAYMNAAATRGDLFTKHVHIDSFYRTNNFYPTAEQQAYIDSRSNEILKDLEDKRRNLGLPEFDNNPPPELKKIVDNLSKSRQQ